MSTIKKKDIQLTFYGEEKTVNALVIDDIFGIHGNSKGYFFLTHIPSGLLIAQRDTRQELILLSGKLLMIDGIDWMDKDGYDKADSKVQKFIRDTVGRIYEDTRVSR